MKFLNMIKLKTVKRIKGFTLIELLAVIVIIALIILIIVPVVTDVINHMRKNSFESSIHGLQKTAENACINRQGDANLVEVTYTFTDGVQSVSPVEYEPLKFKGKTPENGYVRVFANCNIELAINDGRFYIETDVDGDLKEAIVYEPPQLYDGPWIFEVTTTVDNETFSFGVADADLVIDWGDGSDNTYTYAGQDYISHQYVTSGSYDVTVTGTATRITFCNFSSTTCTGTPALLTDIKSPISINMGLTSAAYMFARTEITSFSSTNFFDEASANIQSMSSMFRRSSFNQDISGWDTSNVTTMGQAFEDASFFNQDLNLWDTSKVQNMSWMFYNASSFNGNISEWITSSVTSMSSMFRQSPFNQNIGGWDTTNVIYLGWMFDGATNFNQNISNWDTSRAENIDFMFHNAPAFNQDLSSWCTTSLTTSPPDSFDLSATSWVLPRPVWGTCP